MRVIAGSAKGKRLKVPPGKIRPLSGQAKQALFNILATRIPGSYFLDLFAGTGSVGIEALSRGAAFSIFVELDKKTVQAIRENLNHCGFSDRAEVYALDVLRAIKILKRKGKKFDIIFIGAPYGSPHLEKALCELSEGSLLRTGGVAVAEHRKQHRLSEEYGVIKAFREAKYGETILTFYQIREIK